MQRIIPLLLLLLPTLHLFPQPKTQIRKFVNNKVVCYPKIHLVDIYKSCYQDFLGPEHLVTDRDAAKKYILQELKNITNNSANCPVEKCGLRGDFIRLDLHLISSGTLSADTLSDWFFESSKIRNHSFDQWVKRWNRIEKVINSMNLNLPGYEQDTAYIHNLLSKGNYMCSHSDEYKRNYHPHYRIVSKKILRKRKFKIPKC